MVSARFKVECSGVMRSVLADSEAFPKCLELKEAPATEAWLANTIALTNKYEVTFNDAAYHAVALIHKGLFVTADIRYVNRVADPERVVALSAWSLPGRR